MKRSSIENLTILALALITIYLILAATCGCAGPSASQRMLIDGMIDNARVLDEKVPMELAPDSPNKEIVEEFLHSNRRLADELEKQLRGDE